MCVYIYMYTYIYIYIYSRPLQGQAKTERERHHERRRESHEKDACANFFVRTQTESHLSVEREQAYSPSARATLRSIGKFIKRKRVKLKAKRQAILNSKNPNSKTLEAIRDQIFSIEDQIKETIKNQQRLREEKAVESLKRNPSYFYSYAKRAAKSHSKVGPLFDKNNNLQSDHKVIADLLQQQYTGVFSDPNSENKKLPDLNIDCENTIKDIDFNRDDIISAINEINENAACGEDDIPAVVLKRCKNSLSYPIMCIWKESMQTGVVPSIYKNQTITLKHKKESRVSVSSAKR